ncbi:MAG: hypothetical protein LQ345_001717 [Seirophora villosa]|nr:MAG: hypothetical protein LQ345_001717 [Seirophora villosa]
MASKAFSGPAGSSGAVTPTESTVTQDLPVVNTGPGNIDEDAHNRSSAEHIRARLADLDLPYTGPDQLGTLSTDRDCKSSLINSLLNTTDLAHKYRHRSAQHTAPFTVEAEYCDQDEFDNQLLELLVSYRELHQPGLAKELEAKEQQYREIERKSEVAFSTLQSIFPDRAEVTNENLLDDGDGAFERIFDSLRRLAKKIEWPVGAADGKWAATAASSAECHDKDIDLPSAEEYKKISSSKEGEKAWEAAMHESRHGTAVSSQLPELKSGLKAQVADYEEALAAVTRDV